MKFGIVKKHFQCSLKEGDKEEVIDILYQEILNGFSLILILFNSFITGKFEI